jgi:deazaflavin-dependent oxidoreductase (nitroreductase family)
MDSRATAERTATVDDAVARALDIGPDSSTIERTIDITTLGRRTGVPRRIEVWLHRFDGRWYLTGMPARRSWYANLRANPRFVVHLKHGVTADLSATAKTVEEPTRRRVIAAVLDLQSQPEIAARVGGRQDLDEWLKHSPLVEIVFDDEQRLTDALRRRRSMKYRTLGQTGIKVSPYCLGAMMFGSMGNPDHDESIRIIHKALDAGINFVDTADVYSGGESEVIVGKALKGRRDDVVLASKVHYPMGEEPNHQGNSRRWIIAAVEHSLRRLQTDHLDLYQVHRPDPTVDVAETLSALSDLIHSGKVRTIGSSTFPAADVVEAQWIAERRGLERFRTEQPPYSIVNRSIEREVLPICQRYGMGTLVWSPLGQGLLTGRFRKGQPTDTHRSTLHGQHFADHRKLEVVEQLIPLAESAGLPMTHLAMAFAIAHPGVTSAIIGPRTEEQLEDLLASTDVTLDDEVLDQIDEIAPPGTDAGPNDVAYTPPAISDVTLRRRPVAERSAA